ncbi:MAG TPA: TerC/Alx family metal homeostasis membrane protein [Myxococcota bacterium]|nr:TerC/Alx family metal homeostasis membrane protein [Myxococcota bacterium]
MALLIWAGFLALILLFLAIDLGVFNKTPRIISTREALAWTLFYVSLSLAFSAVVYALFENDWAGIASRAHEQLHGRRAVVQYLTGYVVEYSLSLDNVVVIALIFSYFKVPLAYQHRVLYWGVLGALVFRGLMIGAGAALLARFEWVAYVFGGVLICSAFRMLLASGESLQPEENKIYRLVCRLYPVHDDFAGHRFFVQRSGKRIATRLFLVLLFVETSDVMFAVDSIPAIFAVTSHPFLVFSSNVFAVLGLRSLYFALAPMIEHFKYMKASLVLLLLFVGVKMILHRWLPIPTGASLAVILTILAVGAIASVIGSRREMARLGSPVAPAELEALARFTLRAAWRVIVLVVGGTVLLVGVAMLVLPGPGLIVAPAGLAILATEFVWARRLLARVRDSASNAAAAVGGALRRGSQGR